ncbi:DUF1631 family protein [Inhella gelatinilytica]|uniref:DUF1631 family protein n=1 Tax=Inhella gelatinilytica TaxID=2795030 RepID=A0A931NBT9_9BURK|nr:DUF1631 family protein [Inhella gelatinilytica]MBH9553938.1 DUF1631 family protein [Inhella gelatinilytica]
MTSRPPAHDLAQAARRAYVDTLVKGSAAVPTALTQALKSRLLKPAPARQAYAWRDTLASMQQHGAEWQMGILVRLRQALKGTPQPSAPVSATESMSRLGLVEESTIEREISGARLAATLRGEPLAQLSDLQVRMQALEGHGELAPDDYLRPEAMARLWIEAWEEAKLTPADWQALQDALVEEFAHWLGQGYHQANRWLLDQGVAPEVDLRPFIRRAPNAPVQPVGPMAPMGPDSSSGHAAPVAMGRGMAAGGGGGDRRVSPQAEQAHMILTQLQALVQAQVQPAAGPTFEATAPQTGDTLAHAALADRPVSPRLGAALQRAQGAMNRGAPSSDAGAGSLDELRARSQAFKQVLKQAAGTAEERATIEVVAMMFQSLLQEERLPASVRVWFARLQMPVLRVAISEPDFFATTDHPARQLIDRMGCCVMGFDASDAAGEVLEREIKRVVQVVEAYPDTGRRVFQTVLTEFEHFLSNFFQHENPNTRAGVSLAQQIEQRETLAIQYTIELRRMLSDMHVDDRLRDFLFQVWADVLAVTAVREGSQAEVTLQMKRAAADLIWSASAKGSPEERAEVIRRLPQLLKTLREGMGHAGVTVAKQDAHIRTLNNLLATAFTAKGPAISPDRLEELKDNLQTLESMLPGLEGVELDEDLLRDISGHETAGLDVASEGGEPPTPAMVAWARELPVGSWYRLQFRGREESVQLAWAGARHQLLLFVNPSGRAVLFPQKRLAAYLQAGLMKAVQEESLTIKAAREALARLEANPAALQA